MYEKSRFSRSINVITDMACSVAKTPTGPTVFGRERRKKKKKKRFSYKSDVVKLPKKISISNEFEHGMRGRISKTKTMRTTTSRIKTVYPTGRREVDDYITHTHTPHIVKCKVPFVTIFEVKCGQKEEKKPGNYYFFILRQKSMFEVLLDACRTFRVSIIVIDRERVSYYFFFLN